MTWHCRCGEVNINSSNYCRICGVSRKECEVVPDYSHERAGRIAPVGFGEPLSSDPIPLTALSTKHKDPADFRQDDNDTPKRRLYMKIRIVLLIVVILLAISIGCVIIVHSYLKQQQRLAYLKQQRLERTPVVGIKEVEIYKDDKLNVFGEKLIQAGTSLVIVSEKQNTLQVKLSDGTQGWLRKCAVCSRKEYTRRIKVNELPTYLICIQYDKGKFYFYGGNVFMSNDVIVVDTHQAFWTDPTTHNMTIINNESVEAIFGNSSIIQLRKDNGKIARMPYWGTEDWQQK